jgi:hypothetical protein
MMSADWGNSGLDFSQQVLRVLTPGGGRTGTCQVREDMIRYTGITIETSTFRESRMTIAP